MKLNEVENEFVDKVEKVYNVIAAVRRLCHAIVEAQCFAPEESVD
jgi:hypothetical protein